MKYALFHPIHGYYLRDRKSVSSSEPNAHCIDSSFVSVQGDFITTPEVSQLLGELMAILIISQWKQISRQKNPPKSYNLIELGPGNGTLLVDILRVIFI